MLCPHLFYHWHISLVPRPRPLIEEKCLESFERFLGIAESACSEKGNPMRKQNFVRSCDFKLSKFSLMQRPRPLIEAL